MRQITRLTLWTLVLMLFVGQLYAGVGFKWGARERLRHTYMNNNMDFNSDSDDEQGFIRVRTNLWGDFQFSDKFSAYAMLTNEFRPYTIVRQRDQDAGKEMTFDEIIFDNLYLKYTSGGDNPLTVIFGRQNLIYGEGFILLEGGPWDGSRSIYHDALKISKKKGDMTIDLLAISNPVKDYRLPKISLFDDGENRLGLPKKGSDQLMNDGLEEALGLYITKKPASGTSFEGYYFYKVETPEYALPAFASIMPSQLEKLYVHTIGGRVVHPLSEKLKLMTEWAYQTGGQGEYSVGAYGGYANVAYSLPEQKGVVTGGVNVLSGDDPATADVEGWNPIFSRWPKWSELYIYSQTAENIGGGRKVAYWTNTLSPNLKYVTKIKGVEVTLWAHHLQAFETAGLGDGTVRGNEFQCWLKFGLSNLLPGLTGHVLYDYFIPGDFYPEGADPAQFLRFELMYTFNSK